MKAVFTILVFISTIFAQESKPTRLSTGIVEDLQNNLMWLDTKDVIEKKWKHKEALNYCKFLEFAGLYNWRVPTIEEYALIVDKTNEKNHYINQAFKYNTNEGFWAAQAHLRTLWFYADYMHFVSGTAYFDNRNVYKYVRCVRHIR